jgi:hypothetical protein
MAAVLSDEQEDARLVRKRLRRLNAQFRKAGIFCGLPILFEGDIFESPKGDSCLAGLTRRYAKEFTKRDDMSPPEIPQEEFILGPAREKGMRNAWLIERRSTSGGPISHTGSAQHMFHIAIVERFPGISEEKQEVFLRKTRVRSSTKDRIRHVFATIDQAPRVIMQAEKIAQRKLRELVQPEVYDQYMLTGAIIVAGRSGLNYLIRRYRPTLAMDDRTGRILCALCLHPLGYFSGTWAGALPPTDEVVAHLLMIRGKAQKGEGEHFFWRKANQIPIDEPNSGV